MERLPASPDETTRPSEIVRFLDLLIAVCVAMGIVAWLAVSPRRAIRRSDAESTIMRTATAVIAVIVGSGILLPFLSLVLAMGVLLPVAVALPYLGVVSLRRLLVLSWLLLEELTTPEALGVSGRILQGLAPPFDLAGQLITASVSIGVTLRSTVGATPDELVGEADVAMYEAKRSGKGRVVRFSSSLSKVPGAQARHAG